MLPDRPLDGLRVVSLAQQLPGPYCTMLLAELGAEVVLVEQIPHGDPARRNAGFFTTVNRGKRSVAVDLKTAPGREAIHALIETADVLIEGFRPGVAQRLGVDADTVHALRPGLVHCSISGYGQFGSEALRPGHDLSYQARAGLIDPAAGFNPSIPVADITSALFATVRIVAAVADRGRDGTRSWTLDVSMTDAALAVNVFALAALGSGRPAGGVGSEPGYGVYRTADGAIVLSVAFEDHFWRRLCHALGLPALGDLSVAERRSRSDELRRCLAGELSVRSTEEWMQRFERADVPAERVATGADIAADQLFRARGVLVDRGGAGPSFVPPLGFGPDSADRPAPTVGAHSREVLEPLLGSERYAGAVACGAIHQHDNDEEVS